MDQAQSKKRAAFEDITNAHQYSEPEASGTVSVGDGAQNWRRQVVRERLPGQLRHMHAYVAFACESQGACSQVMQWLTTESQV